MSEKSWEHPVRSEDTRLNSSHVKISYAVFCLKKKTIVSRDQDTNKEIGYKEKITVDGTVNVYVVVFDGATHISSYVRDNVIVFQGRVQITDGAHIGGALVTNGRPEV